MKLLSVLTAWLLLPGIAFSTSLETTSPSEWWEYYASPDIWPAEIRRIKKELSDQFAREGAEDAYRSPSFESWYTTLMWLELYGTNPNLIEDPSYRKAFIELGKSGQIPKRVAAFIQPRDDKQKVLEILLKLQVANPEGVRMYPNLAVAMALVYDQNPTIPWPHHQVNPNQVPRSLHTTVESRFEFYVNSARQGKLLLNPALMTVKDLTFMVDSMVPVGELQWLQNNTKPNLSSLPRAFSTIRYRMDRVQNGNFTWPHRGFYTCSAILKKGGICVDQAYFGFMLGKAYGVPTLLFLGLGKDGGHAWFGYLHDYEHWKLDCGKYREQNYPSGTSYDPQTWQPISNSQLVYLTRNLARKPNYFTARLLYNWARDNSLAPWYLDALTSVRHLIPDFIETWQSSASSREFAKRPETYREKFWKAWIEQFSDSPEYKVEGQEGLASLYEKLGRTQEAKRVQHQILAENRLKRFDVGIDSGVSVLKKHLASEDWAGADAEYRKLLTTFRGRGGSHLFHELVKPYVLILLDAKRYSAASNAFNDGKRSIATQSSSVLNMEMQALARHVGSHGKSR